jgi:hypothetical protein
MFHKVAMQDDNNPGKIRHKHAAQVWCDPKYPDAHRDPMLRAMLLQLPSQGLTIVRYNRKDGLLLIPPHNGKGWEERHSNCVEIIPDEAG